MSKTLTIEDYIDAANELKVEVAAIKAVASVESAGGGFLPDGRVKILFERHHFHKYTKGRFDASHPQISSRNPGGYFGNEKEYQRFNRAFELDPVAAMLSTSWGKFQIMGFNYPAAGFTSIHKFVDAMKESEGEQLLAFCEFVQTNHLDDELQRKDWAGFARGYNGGNYRINNYDGKMKAAYERFKNHKPSFPISDKEINSALAIPQNPASANPKQPQVMAANDISRTPSNPSFGGAVQTSVIAGDQYSGAGEPVVANDTTDKAENEPQSPAPDSNLPTENTVVQVPQVVPEQVETKEATGIKASLAAAVAFITTSGGGIISAIAGAQRELIYGFFASAAVVGVVFIVGRFWYINRKEERDLKERTDREQRAHELQLKTLESAMRKDLQTVAIKPQPIQNSETENKPAMFSGAGGSW